MVSLAEGGRNVFASVARVGGRLFERVAAVGLGQVDGRQLSKPVVMAELHRVLRGVLGAR